MSNFKTPIIFDGHNDFLLRFYRGTASVDGAATGLPDGHIDKPKAQKGGFGGGLFALFVPNAQREGYNPSFEEEMSQACYDLPLPDSVEWGEAISIVMTQTAAFKRLEKAGVLRGCTSTAEIENALGGEAMAAVLHMEGAEAIDANFETLDVLYAAGLRSIGLVWSRPNIFGHGVPFRYPSTGDTGPGLTDAGKALVKACNELGVMLDVSHLNEKGFDDLAAITDAPIVATHSNAHDVAPHARNLTDRQLAVIAESDGMVGVNFAVCFLRPDGQNLVDMDLEVMLRHFDYLIEHLGEDRVGFGSDFDGANIASDIGDISDLPVLKEKMIQHGYNEALMEKLCHKNWLRVLKKTWKE